MTVVEKDKGVCNFLMLCFGLLCKVFMILLVNYDRLVFGFSVMCMNAVNVEDTYRAADLYVRDQRSRKE